MPFTCIDFNTARIWNKILHKHVETYAVLSFTCCPLYMSSCVKTVPLVRSPRQLPRITDYMSRITASHEHNKTKTKNVSRCDCKNSTQPTKMSLYPRWDGEIQDTIRKDQFSRIESRPQRTNGLSNKNNF